jgi:hypothetical protein
MPRVLQALASFWSLLQALASLACQSALSPTSHTLGPSILLIRARPFES